MVPLDSYDIVIGGICLLILCIFGYLGYQWWADKTEFINIKGKNYVVRAGPESESRAKQLHAYSECMNSTVNYMQKQWNYFQDSQNVNLSEEKRKDALKKLNPNFIPPPDPEFIPRLASRWKRLYNGTSPKIRETALNENSAAYLVNKSDELRVCLNKIKDPLKEDNNTPCYSNTTMFVLAHELGHVADENWGHGESFKQAFQYILRNMRDAGLYKMQDFENNPVEFCGVEITRSPCNQRNNFCNNKVSV
tara:strand:+ start:67 stop:816 length:750 start_codon:yes stop_codon:yes gene_type:complete